MFEFRCMALVVVVGVSEKIALLIWFSRRVWVFSSAPECTDVSISLRLESWIWVLTTSVLRVIEKPVVGDVGVSVRSEATWARHLLMGIHCTRSVASRRSRVWKIQITSILWCISCFTTVLVSPYHLVFAVSIPVRHWVAWLLNSWTDNASLGTRHLLFWCHVWIDALFHATLERSDSHIESISTGLVRWRFLVCNSWQVWIRHIS